MLGALHTMLLLFDIACFTYSVSYW